MPNKTPSNRLEIDYTKTQIRQLTPYLNTIEIPPKTKNSNPKKLSLFHRAFAWYYIFNNNNKTDAYKRAKYGVYNKDIGCIQIKLPKHRQKDTPIQWAVRAGKVYNKVYTKEAVRLIRAMHVDNIKVDLPQTFLQQLQIQATYDPEMFYTIDGEPAFESWDEIPQEYRCCIEHLETKFYGREAQSKVIVMKLVDRSKARQELYKFIENLSLNPERFEVIHKTLNAQGKEVGINPKELTDEDLQDLITKLACQVGDSKIAAAMEG